MNRIVVSIMVNDVLLAASQPNKIDRDKNNIMK